MRGVVFDLDETLLDRRGSIDSYAKQLHTDLAKFVVMPRAAYLEAFHRLDDYGRAPRELFFQELASQLFADVSPRELQSHFEAKAWRAPRLFPHVNDVLRRLRGEGWQIGIVTNGGVASQGQKIANSGLSPLVHCIVISAALGSRKPDRAIFEHAAMQLGINPTQSWFVGDDPRSDVWGAKQFGFRAIWVERYLPWPADLPRCYDARIDDTAEIFKVLAGAA